MSTISSLSSPRTNPYVRGPATGSRIKGFGTLAAVQVMAAKQAKANAGVTSTASMLDDNMYSLASKSGVGAASVMLFTDNWSTSTGISGTLLDYYV